jgi:serine/threonine-protein kinase HSL1, negative regulator of Swe1 kinase
VHGPEVHTNWLSRFLHIKPATGVLCFQIGRGKVRQDLVRLLRDWQRFGVRDVNFDRDSNIINARIDKNNRKYTPVALSGWSNDGWVFNLHFEELHYILSCKVFCMRAFGKLILMVLQI